MRRQCQQILLRFTFMLLVAGCASMTTPNTAEPTGASTSQVTTLTVFAAASLTNAFGEIGQQFSNVYPQAEVVFNFAGSNQLAAQIGEGAPVDIFASANAAQMQTAMASGRITSGTQHNFAHNRLVVVAPSDNPAGLKSLADLAQPDLKIVLAAAEVPVGRYTLEFLDKAQVGGTMSTNYKDAVLANVVSYETNVRAVFSKVLLGEADAGIVYSSDVAAQSGQVMQIAIPDALNALASYPIAPLADSKHLALAQQFVDYVLGPVGQKVLTEYGFAAVNGEEK